MRHDQDEALDQCLIWVRDGVDIESCLAHFPEQASELRPLLELAAQLGRVVTPSPAAAAFAAGQQRMFAALTQEHERRARSGSVLSLLGRVLRVLMPSPAWILPGLALFFALILGSAVAVAASGDSLPGDALYPVKLASQEAQLVLTLNAARHQALEERFNMQRRRDVQAAIEGQRQVTAEFEGVLQSRTGDLWTIGGLTVTVQDTTRIMGQPYEGASVRVRCKLPGNGLLLATRLSIEPAETSQPTATRQPAKTLEPTTGPQPTRTLVPSETPEPAEEMHKPPDTPARMDTQKPGPSAETPEPTHGTHPTDQPAAGETPEPYQTIEPIETPAPHEAIESTEIPEPTEAPEGHGAPRCTETPEPDHTRDDDDAPHGTETPEAGERSGHGTGSPPSGTARD